MYFLFYYVLLSDGVPAETLFSMERSSTGMYRVTLKYPHYFPVMRFCRVRATRAAVERAFHMRCKANAPLLKEIIQMRHRVNIIICLSVVSLINYSQLMDLMII